MRAILPPGPPPLQTFPSAPRDPGTEAGRRHREGMVSLFLAAALASPQSPHPGALRAAAGAPAGPTVCLLARADRASTPSRVCAACHDGTVAATGVPGLRGEHPVGVDYAAARARRRWSLLDRPGPALVLVGGRVECTTCHDGASGERHHTALPMARSALCLSCHGM